MREIIKTYRASFNRNGRIQYNHRNLRITNSGLAGALDGLKELRTPFSNKKLTRIFKKLNSHYKSLWLGADAEQWVYAQTRDRAPGVYAEITDLGRFFWWKQSPHRIEGTDENTIIINVYRVDEEGQTLRRALFGFNLSASDQPSRIAYGDY